MTLSHEYLLSFDEFQRRRKLVKLLTVSVEYVFFSSQFLERLRRSCRRILFLDFFFQMLVVLMISSCHEKYFQKKTQHLCKVND